MHPCDQRLQHRGAVLVDFSFCIDTQPLRIPEVLVSGEQWTPMWNRLASFSLSGRYHLELQAAIQAEPMYLVLSERHLWVWECRLQQQRICPGSVSLPHSALRCNICRARQTILIGCATPR